MPRRTRVLKFACSASCCADSSVESLACKLLVAVINYAGCGLPCFQRLYVFGALAGQALTVRKAELLEMQPPEVSGLAPAPG